VTIEGYTQAGSLPATALGPAFMGIALDAVNLDSGLEVLADGCTIRGLAIMNPTGSAIVLTGDGNVVEGNHLGADAAGGALASGLDGVTIAGSGNVVGGAAPEQRNVITGYYGVYISSGGGNRVEGNWIGIDSQGNPGFGQSHGVQIDLSDANEVVGNVISDYFVGMEVWGDRTVIQGNRFGTDPDGLVAIPNGLGVNIEGGDENQIGGTRDGEGNLISGNPIGGIQLEFGLDGAPVGNVLEGNIVGLDATGTVPMPNGTTMSLPGISLVGAQDTTIGGTVPGAANPRERHLPQRRPRHRPRAGRPQRRGPGPGRRRGRQRRSEPASPHRRRRRATPDSSGVGAHVHALSGVSGRLLLEPLVRPDRLRRGLRSPGHPGGDDSRQREGEANVHRRCPPGGHGRHCHRDAADRRRAHVHLGVLGVQGRHALTPGAGLEGIEHAEETAASQGHRVTHPG